MIMTGCPITCTINLPEYGGEISINAVFFRGNPATYWDPGDPPEVTINSAEGPDGPIEIPIEDDDDLYGKVLEAVGQAYYKIDKEETERMAADFAAQ